MDLDEVYEVRSCDDQHAASVPCIWLSSSAKFGVLGVSLTDSLSTLFACENGCLLGSAADQRAHPVGDMSCCPPPCVCAGCDTRVRVRQHAFLHGCGVAWAFPGACVVSLTAELRTPAAPCSDRVHCSL